MNTKEKTAKAFLWNELMESARLVAEQRGERTRVIGVRVGRYSTTRWEYVIECPSSCPCRSII